MHTTMPYVLSAVYNFDGRVTCGLPLQLGETVQILEESGNEDKCGMFCCLLELLELVEKMDLSEFISLRV